MIIMHDHLMFSQFKLCDDYSNDFLKSSLKKIYTLVNNVKGIGFYLLPTITGNDIDNFSKNLIRYIYWGSQGIGLLM